MEARQRASATTAADFGIGRLFDVVPDAVIIGDASTGRIVLWNPAAAEMFGYDVGDGPGLSIEELVGPDMRAAHREGMSRLALAEPTPLLDTESVVELPACRRDGTDLWVELRLAHVQGPGDGRYALAIIRDITIRREAEAARVTAVQELERLGAELEQHNRELDRVARTDHLTGLWNRRHVEEHLTMAISAARRHQRPVAVMLLDIDDFKSINGRFGHQAGDRTLEVLAARLQGQVRTEDTLGRWGGEEFLVVLPETDATMAVAVAERLRDAIAAEPIAVQDHSVAVTVSIGVAASAMPEHDRLLADADAALGRAKSAGKNRVAHEMG